MENHIRLCTHCNNETSHQLIADGGVNRFFDKKENVKKPFKYFFMKCDTCGDYSLLGGFNDQFVNAQLVDVPALFPNSRQLDSSVPVDIRRVYAEASQIRKNPSAFAGQIRRTLEFLCREKQAKGNNLQSQLNSLLEMGIIPAPLNEMTTIIRLLGNIGVHAKEYEVTPSDVNDIDDFFRFIIEYVYIAPAKLERVRINFEVRQLKLEYGNLFNEIQIILINEDPYPWLDTDDGPPSYFYVAETVAIIKKLKELHSKADLLGYVCKEFNTYNTEEFTNRIWGSWNIYKNK